MAMPLTVMLGPPPRRIPPAPNPRSSSRRPLTGLRPAVSIELRTWAVSSSGAIDWIPLSRADWPMRRELTVAPPVNWLPVCSILRHCCRKVSWFPAKLLINVVPTNPWPIQTRSMVLDMASCASVCPGIVVSCPANAALAEEMRAASRLRRGSGRSKFEFAFILMGSLGSSNLCWKKSGAPLSLCDRARRGRGACVGSRAREHLIVRGAAANSW